MSIREQSLAISGPMLWNLLPVDIQNSCSVEVLKKSLTAYYLDSY